MNDTIISFVGDISFNGIYDELLLNKWPNFPFEQIKIEFDKSNIVLGNLESPFAQGSKVPEFSMKTPLKANRRYIEGLKWAGFRILNLSNNHILDYGENGAINTQKILEEHDIEHFGYGKDLVSAKAMKILTADSLKIGFVGYTDIVIDSPFWAGSDTRGVAKFDIDSAVKETTENRKLVDVLIINLHWGIEYFYLPTPDQIVAARKLIDAGADIIIGHHPHVLQGLERYKDGIIAYSLGNFLFSEILWEWNAPNGERRVTKYPLGKRNRKAAILRVKFDRKGSPNHTVIGTHLRKDGRIEVDPSVPKMVDHLSQMLNAKEYERYFRNEFAKFEQRVLVKSQLRRLVRFYKIRPKHLKEIVAVVKGGLTDHRRG